MRQTYVLAAALVVVGLVALLDAPVSSAATCDDYSNQRAAQRAADTRDADGDGIYCESLPCPCLKPGSGGGGGGGGGGRSKPKPRAQVIRAKVLRVTDGDTLKVRAYGAKRKRYDVRIIGIDTPEVHGGRECGGPQASASMRQLARRGSRVVLRTDPTQDLFDRYGRLLAYVQRGKSDLGKVQIRRGWARTYVYGGKAFRRVRAYRRAQRQARRNRRGVYRRCRGRF